MGRVTRTISVCPLLVGFLATYVLAFTVPPHNAATKSAHPIAKPIMASQTTPTNSGDASPQAENDEEDWHPEDPARTTPQFLCALWQMIARGSNMVKGVSLG